MLDNEPDESLRVMNGLLGGASPSGYPGMGGCIPCI